MSVTLTGTAGWGTRMGRCLYLMNQVDAFRGAETDAQVSAIFSQYASNEQIAVNNLYSNRNEYRTVHASWLSAVQQIAINTTIEQVDRDDPLPSKTVGAALAQLIEQLEDAGDYVSRPTVSATATADAGNEGDAKLAVSVADPADGGTLDYAFDEDFKVTVSQDAAAGATEHRELCVAAGDPLRGALEYNWPGGSGVAALSVQATDGETDTLVTDGGFESWTANVPDDWTTVVGAATITKGTAAPLRGNSNLRITSDGSTLTRLRSSSLSLQPLTVYALGVWVKIDTTAAGELTLKLVDGSGTTVADAGSTDNALAIDTSSDLTTSYQCFTAFFRTPKNLPAALHLDVHLTTAPASGRVIDVDTLALVAATQLYTGGPYVALFSGADPIIRGDKWTVAVTNSATGSSLQRGLDRLFGLRAAGLKFPSTTGFAKLHDGLIAQG